MMGEILLLIEHLDFLVLVGKVQLYMTPQLLDPATPPT